MPSAFRDPKTLPNWFELHYFRWPSKMPRRRTLLIWGTLVVSLLVVAALFAFPATSPAFQAGPVCEAHSMFNNRCEECHDQAFQTPRRFLPWNNDVRAVSDTACQKCHEGPKHSALQLSDPTCASCHREHRGRRSLTHMDDGHCTNCHGDLANNRKKEGPPNYENVGKFPAAHPEFSLFVKELDFVKAQKLHFNHAVHLKAEGVLTPGGTKVLNCASCHEIETSGEYLKPVTFEQHCKDCHPLSVQVLSVKDDPKLREAVAAFNKLPAPHKEPEIVRAVLRDRLLEFIQKNPVVLDPNADDRGVPKPRPLEASDGVREWAWSQKELAESEKVLFLDAQVKGNVQVLKNAGGCRYCHFEKKPATTGKDGLVGLPQYEPTKVPQRWMPHARFSHRGHQMLDCAQCHQASESKLSTDVLMPKKADCAKCHNSSVGLRHDCVDCHNYHDRSKPAQNKNLTIEQCLGK